ncbi:restriction endonuclease subunit S [Marinisporobacter balticus]|uniref:Type I restriction enzyme S subunit n=1 Tax=Marinisporobacter balticus TaxID=2018667 RepID=A0A4R2KEN5_9FIRM|nr:restriction endonuclease subunit S [Marinisporobacter balticus]TCO70667.1 type I restriction enzyme S subunit [Marinisporobacter balticus]
MGMRERIEDWHYEKLANVIEINPRSEKLDKDTEITFLAMADVSNDGRILNRNVKSYYEVSKGFTSFKENDVLLAKITPCFENGKRALATKLKNGYGFGSTEFHVLRGNNNLISEYLYQFISLNTFKIRGEANMTGSAGQKRVSTEFLKSYQLQFPPLPEQKKIATILSSVDKHIDEVDGMIEDLKELKKGLMQKLLTEGIGHTEFKDSEVGRIPVAWEVKQLDNASKIIMGQSPKSESYNEEGIGLPLIQGNADCKHRKTVPRVFTSQITKLCDVGDIIMTVRAPVGAISKCNHNACIGRGVCAIRVNASNSGEFIYQYLINFEDNWSKLAQGSTFTAINSNDVKTLMIPVPQINEQSKIASILSSVDNRIEIYEKEKEDLTQLKKALMQQLLTGKTRVKI